LIFGRFLRRWYWFLAGLTRWHARLVFYS
jgi:hypothetical protein